MTTRWLLASLHRRAHASAGFTLFEAVVVLLLVSILSAYLAPQTFNTGALTLDAQARTLASDVQRAQMLAATRGQVVYFCANSNAYALQVGLYNSVTNAVCPPTIPSLPQGAQPVAVTLINSVGFASSVPLIPAPALSFDNRGQPNTGTSLQLVADGSSVQYTVWIATLTGLVSVTSP